MLEDLSTDQGFLFPSVANHLVLEEAYDSIILHVVSRCNREAATFDLRLHSPVLVTAELLADKGDRSPNT
jgi:hypothetical protein